MYKEKGIAMTVRWKKVLYDVCKMVEQKIFLKYVRELKL